MPEPDSQSRRYLIIAPCRNEEKFMRKTLDSLVAQSVRPALLVVVDDGSTDATPQILAEYAAKHDWIRIVTRKDRGSRSVGPGVIEAFYAGLDTANLAEFDYVCKLDLDLILPEGYFEGLMRRMEAEPRWGTLSGKAYYIDKNGAEVSEGIGDEMSIGASKFYRVTCFQQIGGFVRQVMWDGIDCHRCRMMGWLAGSIDDKDIRFIHLRPMGSSHKGIWTGRKRHGFGQWFMGTGLSYMTASSIYRLARPPLIVGGVGCWVGYVESMIKGVPRLPDPEFRRYLRRFQWESLLMGKRRATARANVRQAGRWNPPSKATSHTPSGDPQEIPATAVALSGR